jgi:hypothetical protein
MSFNSSFFTCHVIADGTQVQSSKLSNLSMSRCQMAI